MSVPTDGWRSLDPKVRTVWRVSAVITGLVAGGMALFFEWLITRKMQGYPMPFGLWGLGGLLVFGLPGIIFANLSWKNAKYRLGEDDLAFVRGIFWKSERYVNRARIQHVDITAGPLSRMLGLVEASIHVGAGVSAAISISGLTPEIAEDLKKALLEGSMVRYQAALEAPPQAVESPAEPAASVPPPLDPFPGQIPPFNQPLTPPVVENTPPRSNEP